VDNDIMKVDIEDLSSIKKKLTIEVPPGDVAKEFKAAYRAIKGTADLPGFRKGKVPEKVLRQKFAGHVMGDVATKLIEKTYPEAVKDKDLTPVERPSIEVKNIEEGSPFLYSATVEVNPRFDVKGYRGMGLEKGSVEVTDREVEEGLNRLRENHGEFKDVERPAAKGDMVMVDFEGTMDGKPIEGGRAADFPIILGEGQLIPGFDESLTGACAGTDVEVKTTFPANHKDKTVAGKDALFKVRVKAVKKRVLPGLDDEFAKDLNCDTLEELEAKVREEIVKVKQREEEERLRQEAIEKLSGMNPFEVPGALVDRYLASILSTVVENMKRGIVDPLDRGLPTEKLKDRYRGVALKRARAEIIIDSIARKENVEVSEHELDDDIKKMAQKTNTTPEALRGRLEKEGTLEVIKDGLKREKVFEIITGSKIIVEPRPL
jgi:trigger factor